MYNNGRGGTDKVSEVDAEIGRVKGVLLDTVELAADRGEKIEGLEDKSDQLKDNADMFQKRAKTVRRRYWCMNLKNTIILIVACIVLLWLILSLACGFNFSRCS